MLSAKSGNEIGDILWPADIAALSHCKMAEQIMGK